MRALLPVLAAALALPAACATEPADPLAPVTALIGDAACDHSSQCRTVAIGAKACGGPTGYRAYSDKSVSTASVDALAQQERDLAAAAARASHQVSPCFMLADPGARCQQNKCVTGRSAP